MRDLYLKFSDGTEMHSALIIAGFTDSEGYLAHPEIIYHVVGTIYKREDNDAENTEFIALPGYHVNLRVINDELDLRSLEEFVVNPLTPSHVWA